MPNPRKCCLLCRARNCQSEHMKRNSLASAIQFQQAVDRLTLTLKEDSGYWDNIRQCCGMDQYGEGGRLAHTLTRLAAASYQHNDGRRARQDMQEYARNQQRNAAAGWECGGRGHFWLKAGETCNQCGKTIQRDVNGREMYAK